VAETHVTTRKINNLEDIHRVRDAGVAGSTNQVNEVGPADKFLKTLSGRSEKISQICVVWGKAVALPRYHTPAVGRKPNISLTEKVGLGSIMLAARKTPVLHTKGLQKQRLLRPPAARTTSDAQGGGPTNG
jgi:hypothetical protein